MEGKKSIFAEPEEEHVLHMWQPLDFQIDGNYDYLRDEPLQRLVSGLFRMLVHLILTVYNWVTLGFRIDGWENLAALEGQGAVSVCNHIHPMDCTMVDRALFPRSTYFITLESNFRIPVVRHLIRWLGGVPLSRSPRQIHTLFSQMEAAVKAGSVVQIYPEGVLIPYDDHLRAFRGGAFRLAARCGAPLLPMVITQHTPRGLFRLYKRKPCLRLHILPPLWPDQTMHMRDAAAQLQRESFAAMQQCLQREAGAISAEPQT